MDFLRILRSFEEFVYEALIWLVLVPRTLARIVLRPRRMAAYASSELDIASSEERFGDAVSPPLLLILCVLLAHFVDVTLRPQTPDVSDSLAHALFASEQNLLLYRTIAFGVWALAGAICLLLWKRAPINRRTLRAPFYEQCYLVAPFALLLSIGMSFMLRGSQVDDSSVAIGACLTVVASLWFSAVQVAWVRHRTHLSVWKSAVLALIVLALGALTNAAVAHLLTNTHLMHASSEPAADPARQ